MKATTETKEITITTKVYTLEVTEEELRALSMGMDRLTSTYVTRRNPALATVATSLMRELAELLDTWQEDTDDDEDEVA